MKLEMEIQMEIEVEVDVEAEVEVTSTWRASSTLRCNRESVDGGTRKKVAA